jgi:zinc transport system substrate-binding protein
LIVEGNASPHSFALRPSQARLLENAQLVFWIGPELEAFLAKSIPTIASGATSVALIEAPGVEILDYRDAEEFEEHDHEHDHSEGSTDPHIWLDPANAKAMVDAISRALSTADPENGALYAANAEAMNLQLTELDREIRSRLESVQGKNFMVFHDGYGYFEKHFGIASVGAITINPEIPAGAERLNQIRKKITERSVTCVFSEPQFDPKLVAVVSEGLDVKTGILDPIGSTLESGPELYFSVLRQMADSLANCLSD